MPTSKTRRMLRAIGVTNPPAVQPAQVVSMYDEIEPALFGLRMLDRWIREPAADVFRFEARANFNGNFVSARPFLHALHNLEDI